MTASDRAGKWTCAASREGYANACSGAAARPGAASGVSKCYSGVFASVAVILSNANWGHNGADQKPGRAKDANWYCVPGIAGVPGIAVSPELPELPELVSPELVSPELPEFVVSPELPLRRVVERLDARNEPKLLDTKTS